MKALKILVILFVTLSWSGARSQTIDEALRMAVTQNPGLKAAKQGIKAASYKRKSVRGRFLPQLRLDTNLLYWDSPLTAPMDTSVINSKFQALSKFLPPAAQQALQSTDQDTTAGLSVRDRLTSKTTITVVQPLLQLYGITAGYKAAQKAEQAAAYDYEAEKRRLELAVVHTYCGILASQQVKSSIQAGIKQVRAYEKQVSAFLRAGRVEQNALMKVRVQEADLKNALIGVQKNLAMLKAKLNLLMGRPQSAAVNPQPVQAPPEDQIQAMLRTPNANPDRRPELRALELKTQALGLQNHAKISNLLPKLNAIFAYDHNYGMGRMMHENEYFIGLSLSWPVWEWGASYYALKQNQARAAQLREKAAYLRQQLEMDILARRLDLREALDRLKTSRLKAQQAAENLRVETALYNAGNTTTARLLYAQTQSLRAQNELIAQRIDLYYKYHALRVAQGQDLVTGKD